MEHADVFRALLSAPQSLCAAGVPLGLAGSPLSCQDIRTSVVTLAQRAQRIRELAQNVASGMGESETLQSAFDVLHLLGVLSEAAAKFLADRDIPVVGLVTGVADARLVQAHAVLAMTDGIEPYARRSISVGQAVSGIRAALDAELFLANISADSGLLSMFGPYLQGLRTDEVAISTCLSWASSVSQVVTKLPVGAADCFVRSGAAEAAPAAGAALSTGNDSRKAYERLMDAFSQTGRLDWNLWGGFPLPSDAVIRLERARDGSVALIPWSKYLAAKDDASELGVSELVLAAESGRLFHGHLVDAFEYVFYRSLSRGILGTHRDLARFSGGGHETLRREFSELDREVIRLNGGVYAAKVDAAKKPQQGIGTGRAGDLSEMALLVKETTKKTKHIPIRQLLKRAGKSLQELKPCFMMGPLSVAQYLEQGVLQFDLVVMDEASQLRPEEALGAIARGKQLVVVGDPKQLPPTNFFDRLMEPDDEDPDDTPAVVDGVESVLGICELLYRPVRTLRWHYRSRHESLIAFSNKQFYDGRLVVFPSPFKRNKRLGVNYRYVPDGIYQDRRNQPEAQRLVDAVVEHMLKCPEESLGVVTLNQTQRELIEDLLDKKVRGLKGVAEYLDRHEQAGWKFFIKNLENVQGDERDVIFVSTTFGKPPGASVVRQNFGPINRPDGWRRLNVLFTRARMRLDLFSSMLPSDVKLDEKASLGRRALQQYLEYAKTGILPSALPVSTGRQADSDFEVSVAGALRIHGFDAEPQVGVAGYFIDIGVKHPDRRGEYLAGIECDGATYHSSLSARDRDRIRQEIIESLGWRGRIIRVWSTDWFADPQGQTLRLTQFLQQRRTDDKGLDAPYADDQDFDDDADEEIVDVPSAEVEVVPTSTSAVSEQLSLASIAVVRVRATSDDRLSLAEQSQDVVLFIDLGDRVTYEVIDVLNERHTVQIVDSASNARLGLINEGTPVARVLYGLCVGDEAPLKVAGQQLRRLRVLKIARESQGSMQEAN